MRQPNLVTLTLRVDGEELTYGMQAENPKPTFAELLDAFNAGYAGTRHPTDYSKKFYDLLYWACRCGKSQRPRGNMTRFFRG